MLNHVISIIIIHLHLTKIENQKEMLEKEERKGIKTLIAIIPYPIAFEL